MIEQIFQKVDTLSVILNIDPFNRLAWIKKSDTPDIFSFFYRNKYIEKIDVIKYLHCVYDKRLSELLLAYQIHKFEGLPCIGGSFRNDCPTYERYQNLYYYADYNNMLTEELKKKDINDIIFSSEFMNLQIAKFLYFTKNNNTSVILLHAVKLGHSKLLKYLISKRIFPDAGSFTEAVDDGYFKIVKTLCKTGRYVEKYQDSFKIAINNGRYKIAKLLYKKGALISYKKSGKNLLKIVIEKIKILIKDLPNDIQNIILAIYSGNLEILKQFLTEPRQKNWRNENILLRLSNENLDNITSFFKKDTYYFEYCIDIVDVCACVYKKIIDFLSGTVTTVLYKYRAEMFLIASFFGYLEIIKFLGLEIKPSVSFVEKHAVEFAIINGHYKIAKFLLKNNEVSRCYPN